MSEQKTTQTPFAAAVRIREKEDPDTVRIRQEAWLAHCEAAHKTAGGGPKVEIPRVVTGVSDNMSL